MRRNRIIYILLVLACIVFSAVYQSTLAGVLLTAVAGYPIAALIFTAAGVFFADAGFMEERSVYEKNQPFELWIYIRSKLFFAYAPVELECMLPDRETGLFAGRRIFASVPPFGRCRISSAGMHKFRGTYTAQLQRIAVYDPLRIIRVSRRLKAQSTLVFLPRRIALGELPSDSGSQQTAGAIPLRSGEKEDFSHVREYKIGDIIQLVHWKLTAKQDSLMIKQYDEISDRRAAILCDLGFEGAAAGNVMRRADSIIETAIAFAMSHMESGMRCTADFGDTARKFVCDIDDRPGFERFYQLMTVIPPKPDTYGFTELIRQYENSGASAAFLITTNLTEELILCADRFAQIFGGEAVLIYISFGGQEELAAAAGGRRFILLELNGEAEDLELSAGEA